MDQITSIKNNPIIRLLNEQEAAFLIRKSPAWLRQDRQKERKIPFRKIGRHVRYDEADLLTFIENHPLQTSVAKTSKVANYSLPKKTI